MHFPCARCGRTYEIADELVVGRAVKVACPACGNLVVHRVPAAGSGENAPQPPPPPPPASAPALADANDDDFENAWAAVEAPSGPLPQATPAQRASLPAPRPAPVVRPPPGEPDVDDADAPTVTAELVLIRQSARRTRLTAAAVAVVVIGALAGGGALASRWRRPTTPPGAADAARRGTGAAPAEGAGSPGGLSEGDMAKLMGKRAAQPEAVAPAAPRAADRPKRAKLTGKDRDLLDLLGKKGDAAVTVQEEEAHALDTTRSALDPQAIEATLSRNAGSISACVSRALSADPSQRLNGKRVNLELTIRPSGRVQKAAVAEKEISRSPLGVCIAQAARRMIFPGFDGEPIDISVPIKLQVTF